MASQTLRQRCEFARSITRISPHNGARHNRWPPTSGGVGQQILTSAKSGAHRPLWRNILSDLGSEFWAEFRKEIGKNVVRPFSVRAVQHLDRQIRKLAVRIQPGNLRVAPRGRFSKVDIREYWPRKANARRAARYIVEDRNAT